MRNHRNRLTRAGLRAAVLLMAFCVGLVLSLPAYAQTVTKTWALQNDVNGNTLVNPGDTIRYTIAISGALTNVTFTDGVPDSNTALVVGSVTTTQGTILSGNSSGDTQVGVQVGDVSATVTITFDITVKNPMPVGVNQVANQGGIACDSCGTGIPSDDPSTATVGDPTITPVVASPSLTVTKAWALQVDADGNAVVSPGDTLRYTVGITNNGDQDAAAVFVDAIPDPNTALVVGSVTSSQGTVVTGNTAGDTAAVVNLGAVVAGGGVVTITFDVTIANPLPAGVNQVGDQGGVLCSNCTPQTQPTDDPTTPTPDDPTLTSVVAAPDITATKAVALLVDENGNGQVNPGDVLQYTVVIANNGNQDAGGVIFNETIPAATALLVGSVTATAGTIVSGNNPDDTTVNVQIPTLAGLGGSVTITYQTQVKGLIGTAIIVNQGTVSGGNFPSTVTDNPNTPAPSDATTILAFGPAPAPALSAVGLLFLVALLAAVAMRGLRRGSTNRLVG